MKITFNDDGFCYVLFAARPIDKLPDHGPFDLTASGDARYLFALPWGKGDPLGGNLDNEPWIVARLGQEDIVPVGEHEDIRAQDAIAFQSGRIVYSGEPRGALECLIAAGARPQDMATRLVAPSDSRVASTGDHGVAVAGTGGYASAGMSGFAYAGAWGVAQVRFGGGRATAGDGGIAIAGPLGMAEILRANKAGGLAVARYAYASAFARDDCGMAIATSPAEELVVGNRGYAIAPHGAGRIHVGNDAIVIVREAPEQPVLIEGGQGTLVIYLTQSATRVARDFTVEIVGQHGITPNTLYLAQNGTLYDYINWQHQEGNKYRRVIESNSVRQKGVTSYQFEHGHQKIEWWSIVGAFYPHCEIWAAEPAPDEVVVLARSGVEDQCVGKIRAEHWDPDPTSPHGFVGLPGGRGDLSLLSNGVRWWLVAVDEADLIPLKGRGGAKFERGTLLYAGCFGGAIRGLQLLGADPATLAVTIKEAGQGFVAELDGAGLARAGTAGWALARHDAEAGDYGFAEALEGTASSGTLGCSVAYGGGFAVSGKGGIAVSRGERWGVAETGEKGLSVALGRAKVAKAGDGGIALSMHGYANVLSVGDEGIAVGWGQISAGRNAIAVQLGESTICGGDGALLVARNDIDDDDWLVEMVGMNGIAPGQRYFVREGQFLLAEAENF